MPDKEQHNNMLPSAKTVLLPLIFVGVVILLMAVSFLGIAGYNPLNPDALPEYRFNRLLMNTDVSLVFYTDEGRARAEEISAGVFHEMQILETQLSRGLKGNAVMDTNFAAGINPVKITTRAFEVMERGIYYGDISDGAFDITIAPLMDAWGFFNRNFRMPPAEDINAALELVDYRRLSLDAAEQEAFLPREGMAIDLGGIAKGYIVDRGIEILQEEGIEHAFLNAGGDIRVLGGKPGDEPWRIGIQHPRTEVPVQKLMAVITLEDSAVVTSGDYERYFEEDGSMFHHILDPRTGYPARKLTSVTIVASDATTADALSTAVFVMGPDKGMELVESLEKVEAVLITNDLDIFYSSGLSGIIEIK